MEVKEDVLGKIISRSWVKIVKPPDTLFFFNPISNESVWEKPSAFSFKIPYVLHVKEMISISGTTWDFILLNNNDFFFFNKITFQSSWVMNDQLRSVFDTYLTKEKMNVDIKQPIQEIEEQDDDDDEEDDSDSEGFEIFDEGTGVVKPELDDQKEDDDEFEVFDSTSGELIQSEVAEIVSKETPNVVFNMIKEEEEKITGGKRVRNFEDKIEEEGMDKKKPKTQKVTCVDKFLEMMEEGEAEGKITCETTYQVFFRLFIRDMRFRKLKDNTKRKELFNIKLQNMKNKL